MRPAQLIPSLILWSTALAAGQGATQAMPPPPPEQQTMRQASSSYPMYTPTNFVRLMVVTRWDYVSVMPFITAVVTTQGDDLVVATIPNGDPPTAFNVTEDGFRAQNGKFLFFDRVAQKVRLDSQPHNETQYMEDGSIYSTDITGDYIALNLCPGPRNIYTINFGWPCGNNFVNLYPIPPQHLTGLWENQTEYPSPRQRGWLNWDAENVTIGDNTTVAPMLTIGTTRGTASRPELAWTWLWALLALAMFFF